MNSSEVGEGIADFTVAGLINKINSASVVDFRLIEVGKQFAEFN